MRVLLADDHALFRDGVASLLGAWGHEIVGLASSGPEAVELAGRLAPDLVLMDVRMPGGSGLEATARIKADRPETAIVMLTVSEDEDDLFAAIKAGANGYLLKNLEGSPVPVDDRGGRSRRGGDRAGHRGPDHRGVPAPRAAARTARPATRTH